MQFFFLRISRFERLQKGMTVAEASEILGKDLENYCEFDISGVAEEYRIENRFGIFPIEEFRIAFFCGRLSYKECTKSPPTLFWSKTISIAKELLRL